MSALWRVSLPLTQKTGEQVWNCKISCSGSEYGKDSQLALISIESFSRFSLYAGCDRLIWATAALCRCTQLN